MSSPASDPIAVLEALGLEKPSSIEPVTGGSDTSIWRVVHEGCTYALRVFRVGQRGTCEHEMTAMRAAADHLPVPAVHREGILAERAALLLAWCPGMDLSHHLRDASADVEGLGVAFGRAQARVHAIPAPDRWSAEEWIGRCGADKQVLQEQLRALATNAPMLLHLDYHPMNVMAEGSEITAVLDWTNAAAGDPRADYARTYSILHFANIGDPERMKAFARGWQEGYVETAPPLEDLDLFFAWAGAYMVHDLEHKIDQLPPLFTRERLADVARWADDYEDRGRRSCT